VNIAYVSNVVYPFVTGGAEKRIYEIGTRLVDRGHDVTVYSRHFWDGPSERTFEGLELRAVADERSLYTDGRRSIQEAIEFAMSLRRPLTTHIGEHDVLVASVFPYFPVFPAAARTWRTDVPLVTTWHECWREYWWEYLGALGSGGIAVERAVAKLPQYPIAVSSVTADRLAAIGPDRDRIAVVPNGIDYEEIRATTPVKEGFDLLFAGRLIDAKNIDTLLRALTRLDAEVTLGIIGDGPVKPELEQLAATLGITSQVTFLGFVEEYDDVIGQMKAADVFVAPSTREGFGITLVEAMAANCTVVAVEGPQTAAAEVIGDAGILVGASPAALADGIERALTTPQREAGKQRAARYDWEAVTTQALGAYEDAVFGTWGQRD